MIQTDNMIPVTKLQKELTKKLKQVSDSGEPLYVFRNNEMAAVIVSAEEYDLPKQAEEVLEHFEIAESINQRLQGCKRAKNIPWEKIKKQQAV